METFFAYSRILKKQSEKTRSKVRTGGWPAAPNQPIAQPKRPADLTERLRLASTSQGSNH